jgi:hypothetical protein
MSMLTILTIMGVLNPFSENVGNSEPTTRVAACMQRNGEFRFGVRRDNLGCAS